MDLVVLAAGLGSRFGGNKQIEPVDADENFILDYSVFDAVRAGFERVIFVIREEHKQLFEDTVGARMRKLVPVKYAFQSLEDVPNGINIPKERTKPWGTAHALFACRDIVSNRFAVINADDFYGFSSFLLLHQFLEKSKDDEFASVGYKLAETLSEQGCVKRGIFSLKGNLATKLVESRVERRAGRIFATPLNEENWQEVSPNTLASMTMFGFSKKIIEQIAEDEKTFFSQDQKTLQTCEFLLPEVVNGMSKKVKHYVLPTKSKWHGITYREDLANLKKAIEQMKKENLYPSHLYS